MVSPFVRHGFSHSAGPRPAMIFTTRGLSGEAGGRVSKRFSRKRPEESNQGPLEMVFLEWLGGESGASRYATVPTKKYVEPACKS